MPESEWTLRLVTPDAAHDALRVADPLNPLETGAICAGVAIRLRIERLDDDTASFDIVAEPGEDAGDAPFFLEWRGQGRPGDALTFDGLARETAILRQSPHDPADHAVDMPKQAVPVAGVRQADGSVILAIGDTPALYENYTSQFFDPARGIAALCSGDTGERIGTEPRRSKIEARYTRGKQAFSGVFRRAASADVGALRADIFRAIASRWSPEPLDGMGAVAFASNYMHLRVNETGHSRYWICPGIEYANKQYSRDAFWQSMMLPPEYEQECYGHECDALSGGAERPLFALLWSYRIFARGGEWDRAATANRLEYVEAHLHDGFYIADAGDDGTKRDFQSWYDLCAFDRDDVITYNQGLAAAALLACERMGLPTRTPPDLAARRYRELFDEAGGYFPLSRKKPLLAVDVLAGDVVAHLFFDAPLLDRDIVLRHFEKVMASARTPHGFKVTCNPDGSYADAAAYDAAGVRSTLASGPVGAYQWGGSWYLYDLLFLVGSCLHGAPGAEETLLWRALLDFERGGTYHECTDTVTGELWKANQGWNGAIYALCREFVRRGRMSRAALDGLNGALKESRTCAGH